MNSLNILSSISSTTPQASRTNSPALTRSSSANGLDREALAAFLPSEKDEKTEHEFGADDGGEQESNESYADEQTALLGLSDIDQDDELELKQKHTSVASRLSTGIVGAVKVVIAWITSPCKYIVAYFYDEHGRFSPLLPLMAIARALNPRKRRRIATQMNVKASNGKIEVSEAQTSLDSSVLSQKKARRPSSSGSIEVSSSGSEGEKSALDDDSPARHTRSRSTGLSAHNEDTQTSRRSIRIKFRNEDSLKRRRKAQEGTQLTPKEEAKEAVAASLKSPSSPTSLKITKFPRAPQPPRPLVPRRQPSYSKLPASTGPFQKTLILDLDETLIHSVSKGGRYATGHMVEVRMPHPVGYGGVTIGAEVPILYYVHKRPHCDEFLRKVSKWYNLVIFTASVPQYADPVIDWLEMEKKYFSARYYRQHCTYRNGAYIKDLSQVEDDLRNVMIIDNTPQCYVFHEDNAIPIEGWINDPTDSDLLHLIPILEGLQYATDVRALLALRLGQPQAEAI